MACAWLRFQLIEEFHAKMKMTKSTKTTKENMKRSSNRSKKLMQKNNTGKGITFHGSIVKFGLKGSPDIIGFTEHGTFIGIEVKTGNAVQNKFQKAFQKKLEESNGIYKVIRPGAILEKVL